jgi:hypothetical protein
MTLHSKENLFYAMRREVIIQLLQSIQSGTCTLLGKYKNKTFSCLTNRKYFSGSRKGGNPEIDVSV